MTKWKGIAIAAGLVVFGGVMVKAEDWSQWRGPHRDGHSPEKGWLTEWPKGGPKVLWTNGEIGIGCASVAVSGKRLYTMGNLQLGKKDCRGTRGTLVCCDVGR